MGGPRSGPGHHLAGAGRGDHRRDVRTGETREPTPDDEEWWLAVRFPFETLSAFTGLSLAPESGDRWRANFHRTGVESLSQEASWNPIGTEEKQFHSPGHFGWLRFG
ncbi:carbohydrate-binding family 9-like protein [Halosimplex aquaticum]